MKKWNAIGILTVLVNGMVFMGGCISPVATSTPPVVTPPQVVNEIVPVPPSQSLATGVSAGTTLLGPAIQQILNETMPVTPAQAAKPAEPMANEIVHNESTNRDKFIESENTGGLIINIRAGGSVEGLKVFIARDGTNVSPIEYSFLPDRTVVEGENKGYLQVKILPDGHSEIIKLLPGNYTAYLPDWNGGEPEQQSFMITEEVITPIWLRGFAASSGGCGC
jgi:hypothetical protein